MLRMRHVLQKLQASIPRPAARTFKLAVLRIRHNCHPPSSLQSLTLNPKPLTPTLHPKPLNPLNS